MFSARFFLFTRGSSLPAFQRTGGGTHWSGAELGRLLFPSRLVMYSVFRNHVTVGTACDELEPLAELLTNNVDPPVGSPSRTWSLGSNFGRFFGSGFSAIRKKTRKRVQATIISRNTGHNLDRTRRNTHLNHPHRLSTMIPTTLNLTAYRTLRQRSSVEACRLPESRETLVERISWGSLGYPGVLEDMVGEVMGLSSEPVPKGRFYCKTKAVSYRTVPSYFQTLTFSLRPWRLLAVERGYQMR